MKYSKYEIGPYNLHIIKTDKFKTINMHIDFRRKAIKGELTYRRLLSDILFESTAKYPSQRSLIIAKEDLYNQKISGGSRISGKTAFMSFSTQFLNEKYTEKGMLEKSITFFLETIFEPDFKDGNFRSDKLEIVKNKAVDSFKERDKNPSYYAYVKMLEAMDPNAYYSFVGSGYMDDLEKITPKSLTEYYKKVIHSDLIDVFIVGDVDNQVIKKMLTERIPVNTIKKQSDSLYIEHEKVRKRAKKVKENFDSKQSQLVMGAKISKLTDFEKNYVWYVYNYILGRGPDSKLFNTVREKHSLCYSISSQIKILSNILIIRAGINQENGEKTIKLIRKEINNIAKGLIEETEISNTITTFVNSFKEITNSPISIMEYYIARVYYNDDDIDMKIANVQKITKQMIVDFAKKIHVDTIFLLEGGG